MSRQVLPRLTAMTQFTSGLQDTASTFWESPNGQKLVNLYEAAVYNEYADAEDWLYIIMAILCLLLFWRFCCVCRERCCGSRKKKRRAGYYSRRRGGEEDEYEEDEEEWDEEEEMMRTPVPDRTPPARSRRR